MLQKGTQHAPISKIKRYPRRQREKKLDVHDTLSVHSEMLEKVSVYFAHNFFLLLRYFLSPIYSLVAMQNL